ncbi:hypothetical protein PENSTE_c006G00674 [Penicillium steckii]|uniref:Ubiquitin-like domain-containing protein n=1 Tax=Penicillium steckii TaxID=303698 RepID=A0A1V6TFM8_9EURO|nr:hypothetical protein PENSTE_c006G00674 [Penicillium steckii]
MASPAFLTPERTTDPADALITVRFSASIPDLPLDVSEPQKTTGAGLKQLIRENLPEELSSHRLRLIYAGRGLEDSTALSISLKLPPSPTRTPRPAEDSEENFKSGSGNGKDKGKQPVRDNRPRIYIHCSIGDIALSEVDLAAEASIASIDLLQKQKDEESKPDPRHGSSLYTAETSTSHSEALPPPPTTTPAPRGFDRLLSAGFTPSEVTALRSQFLAVQSVSRTPDTMPSGEELRDLEDRWMDEGSTGVNVGADGGGNGGGIGEDDGGFGSGSRSAMDDMLWGAVMGFFWPIGCAMWLRREEGVWSWRKGVAVFVGVLVNAAFGTMRIMN